MNIDRSQREQTLTQLRNILIQSLHDVPINIYLFGSWARDEEKRTSDIDIALQSPEEIPIKKLVELREEIEESTLAFNVDIVDLSKTSSTIRNKVTREGIVWKDCTKDYKAQKGL